MIEEVERQTIGRVMRRLLPLLCLMYLVAYIDRQNVSFAKLQMATDLRLSESAFGLGSSLFFVGYFLFELPSNLMLARIGAGPWFARIMASWGLVTILLGFTPNGPVFYFLRFLLGAAEAGLFPGVLYVLTLWLPSSSRGRAIGLFMIAGAAANAIGAAVGGLLLGLDGAAGLRGWQWLFLATGLPALVLAPVVWLTLPAGPGAARWLTAEQKSWLATRLAAERGGTDRAGLRAGVIALADPKVAMLCAAYLGYPLAAYGLSYWLPTLVRGFGVSNLVNGLLNALLWAGVALALWVVPRHAARSTNEHLHLLLAPVVGAVALVVSVAVPGAPAEFAALCVAAAAIFAGQPLFWTLPPRFLTGAAVAAGFAAINSVGNLGGFIAQAMVPSIADATGSAVAPMLLLACALVCAAALTTLTARRLTR